VAGTRESHHWFRCTRREFKVREASVDQVLQWGFLKRERFLAAWIVLFAMGGLYLLGFVRLDGVKPDEPNGAGAATGGNGLPGVRPQPGAGMFGAKLGALDAYVPWPSGPPLYRPEARWCG